MRWAVPDSLGRPGPVLLNWQQRLRARADTYISWYGHVGGRRGARCPWGGAQFTRLCVSDVEPQIWATGASPKLVSHPMGITDTRLPRQGGGCVKSRYGVHQASN